MVRDRAGRTACHRLLERPQAPLCLGSQTAPSHPTSSRYRSNAESRIDLADAPLTALIHEALAGFGVADRFMRGSSRHPIKAIGARLPGAALALICRPCLLSPKPMPLRSVLSLNRRASCRPQLSCAAGSPASLTTPRRGNVPGPSPGGSRDLRRCPRQRGCILARTAEQRAVGGRERSPPPARIGVCLIRQSGRHHSPQVAASATA